MTTLAHTLAAWPRHLTVGSTVETPTGRVERQAGTDWPETVVVRRVHPSPGREGRPYRVYRVLHGTVRGDLTTCRSYRQARETAKQLVRETQAELAAQERARTEPVDAEVAEWLYGPAVRD